MVCYIEGYDDDRKAFPLADLLPMLSSDTKKKLGLGIYALKIP